MSWQNELLEGEQVRWEGRPAPRCYTFRHWKHSVFGLVFFAVCLFWQILGMEMATTYSVNWLRWLPLPFVLVGLYFAVGHLIQARLEWNNIYYAITDRRVLVQRGKVRTITFEEMTYFSLHRHGDELGTLRIYKDQEMKLILHCIEYPQRAVKLLEEAIKNKVPPVSTAGME